MSVYMYMRDVEATSNDADGIVHAIAHMQRNVATSINACTRACQDILTALDTAQQTVHRIAAARVRICEKQALDIEMEIAVNLAQLRVLTHLSAAQLVDALDAGQMLRLHCAPNIHGNPACIRVRKSDISYYCKMSVAFDRSYEAARADFEIVVVDSLGCSVDWLEPEDLCVKFLMADGSGNVGDVVVQRHADKVGTFCIHMQLRDEFCEGNAWPDSEIHVFAFEEEIARQLFLRSRSYAHLRRHDGLIQSS